MGIVPRGRLVLRILLGVAGLIVLLVVVLLVALQTSRGRHALLGAALRAVEAQTGFHATAGGLEVAVLGREVRLVDFALSPPGAEPLLRVAEARVSWPVLPVGRGLVPESVRAEGVRIDLRRGPDGQWNVPVVAGSVPRGGAPVLPLRISVRDVAVTVRDPGNEWEAEAHGLVAEASGTRSATRGTVEFKEPLRWRAGRRKGEILLGKAVFGLGRALTLEEWQARAPEGTVHLAGTCSDVFGRAELAFRVGGDVDLGRAMAAAGGAAGLEGAVQWSGGVGGVLAAPEARVDFRGRLTRSALGPADLDGRATLASSRIEVAEATLRVASGRATGRATVVLEGTERSRLEAEWAGLDLGALVEPSVGAPHRAPVSASLGGRLQASWPGREWRRADADVLVGAKPGDVDPNRLGIEGRVHLGIDSGRWSLETDARAGQAARLVGRLGGEVGPSDLAATSVTGRIDLALDDLAPLGRVLGKGRITGRGEMTLVASGTLGAPEASLAARAVDLSAGGMPATSLEARARVDRKGLEVDAFGLHAGSAHAQAAGRVRFPGGGVDGRFELDLPDLAVLGPALPAGFDPTGALHGSGLVTGAWTAPRVALSAAGSDLRALGQSARTGRFELRFESGRLEADVFELAQESGRLDVRGRYVPREKGFELEAQARDFEIGALPAGLAGPGPLAIGGRIDVDFDGGSLGREASGGGKLTVRDARWEGRSLGDVGVDLGLSREGLRATLEAGALSLRADGLVRPGPRHPFSLTAALEGADLGRWSSALGQDAGLATGTASLNASASGSLDDLRSAEVSLVLTELGAALRGGAVRLEREARISVAPGLVRVEGLDLVAGESRFHLDGALDRTGRKALQGSIAGRLGELVKLVTPALEDRVGGSVRATFVASGPPHRPEISGEADVEDGSLRPSRPGAPPIEGLAARVVLRAGVLRLERLVGSWSGAMLTASGDVPGSFLRTWLPFELAGSDRGGRAASFRARAEGSAGRLLAPFLGGAEEFGRTAVLSADLTAEASRLRSVRGQIRLEGADLRLGTVALHQEGPATIQIEGGRLVLPDAAWKGSLTELHLDAQAALGPAADPLGGATLEAELSGEADLQLVGGLTRGIESGGTGSIRLRAKGPVASLETGGEIRLNAATLRHRASRFSLDGLTGLVRWNGSGFEIEALQGTLNGGSLQASGALRRREAGGGYEGAVQIQARNAFAEWPHGLQARLRANLALEPAGDGLRLGGTLRILDGSYRTREYFSLQVLEVVERFSRGSPPSPFDPLGLDIAVRSGQDVLLNALDGRLLVGVDLRLTGSVGEPALGGRLTAAPGGQVFMSGRTYDIDSAILDFSRGSGFEPYVQAQARTRVGDYAILADVAGPAMRAETRLASTPPLPQPDLVALLTSGRTVGTGATGAIQTDALSLASGGVLGRTGQIIGLDSLRIESSADRPDLDFDPTVVSAETDPSSRLTFSKRLASNVSATFSRSLTKTGTYTWFVAYKPRPSLELRLVQRDDETGALEFRHDLSFDGAQAAPAPTRRRRRRSGETVSEVRIVGDEGATRLSDLRLRQGQPFDYDRWLEDRDRVEGKLGREGHAEARVLAMRETPPADEGARRPRTVALVYEVRRGPRTRVEVTGTPRAARLRELVLGAWRRGEYGASIEEEAETVARADLYARGFLRAEVRARLTISPSGDEKTLAVEVEPGEPVVARRIVFEGNSRVATPALEALVQDPAREAAAWLRPADLAEAVAQLYRSEGLLAAKVAEPRRTFVGNEARLAVAVDEGPPVTIAGVKVSGTDRLDEKAVLAAAALPEGQPFKPADVEGARARVEAAYRRLGFNEAAVRIDGRLDPKTATMALDVRVKEGAREVLEDVAVEGASPGLQARARPLLGLVPGEPVVLEEWTEARRRIYETGLYRRVDLEESHAVGSDAPHATGDRSVKATLKLEPWPALRLRYGLQLVTVGNLASESGRQDLQVGGVAEATRRTLFGRAISTGLSLQARKDEQVARVFASAPRTLGTPVRSSVFLTYSRESDVGGNLSARRQTELTWEERWRARRRLDFAGAYKVQWTRLDLEDAVPGLSPSPRFDVRLSRVVGTALFDARNDLIDTSRGSFSSASYEWGGGAIGSDLPLRRLLLQQFAYVPLPGGLVLGAAVRAESAAGAGSGLLETDRLQAGGANTVRGYADDVLVDPAVISFLEGATRLVVGNLELRLPIRGPVRGVLFGDGAVLREEFVGGTRHRSIWSTGIGLRYVTPVGILRVDYGIPLDEGFDPKRGRVYFSLGQVF
jgi:outer membrane protein assembly factor BamA